MGPEGGDGGGTVIAKGTPEEVAKMCIRDSVNTVPAPVVTRVIIKELPRDAYILDIASKPGGTDFACAKAVSYTHLDVYKRQYYYF